MGPVRDRARGSQATRLAGAPDDHGAGAALGDRQRQIAVHHAPDPKDFEEFTTAVAREFGSQVSTYSIWNEPNESVFLLPQWNSNGTPASGRIYRGLYQAGYAGLQAGGLAHPKVLFGETAPIGLRQGQPAQGRLARAEHPVAPLAFMREALCLNAKYKKAASCSELQISGYAHHAYTLPAGPYFKPAERDNVDDRCAFATVERVEPGRQGARDPRRRADLPDRVRRTELPEQVSRRVGRQAG